MPAMADDIPRTPVSIKVEDKPLQGIFRRTSNILKNIPVASQHHCLPEPETKRRTHMIHDLVSTNKTRKRRVCIYHSITGEECDPNPNAKCRLYTDSEIINQLIRRRNTPAKAERKLQGAKAKRVEQEAAAEKKVEEANKKRLDQEARRVNRDARKHARIKRHSEGAQHRQDKRARLKRALHPKHLWSGLLSRKSASTPASEQMTGSKGSADVELDHQGRDATSRLFDPLGHDPFRFGPPVTTRNSHSTVNHVSRQQLIGLSHQVPHSISAYGASGEAGSTLKYNNSTHWQDQNNEVLEDSRGSLSHLYSSALQSGVEPHPEYIDSNLDETVCQTTGSNSCVPEQVQQSHFGYGGHVDGRNTQGLNSMGGPIHGHTLPMAPHVPKNQKQATLWPDFRMDAPGPIRNEQAQQPYNFGNGTVKEYGQQSQPVERRTAFMKSELTVFDNRFQGPGSEQGKIPTNTFRNSSSSALPFNKEDNWKMPMSYRGTSRPSYSTSSNINDEHLATFTQPHSEGYGEPATPVYSQTTSISETQQIRSRFNSINLQDSQNQQPRPRTFDEHLQQPATGNPSSNIDLLSNNDELNFDDYIWSHPDNLVEDVRHTGGASNACQ